MPPNGQRPKGSSDFEVLKEVRTRWKGDIYLRNTVSEHGSYDADSYIGASPLVRARNGLFGVRAGPTYAADQQERR